MPQLEKSGGRAVILVEGEPSRDWSMKLLLRCGTIGLLVGVILGVASLIVVILESGYAHASRVCALFVYIAYWPVIIIGWDMHDLFVSFWVIPANVLGWTIVAYLSGIVTQAIAKNRTAKRK